MADPQTLCTLTLSLQTPHQPREELELTRQDPGPSSGSHGWSVSHAGHWFLSILTTFYRHNLLLSISVRSSAHVEKFFLLPSCSISRL